jgi:gliding motility-associated-like protein
MKAVFLYCFIFMFVFKDYAQINLVPNPSFEDTVRCPTGLSQLYNGVLWTNANGGSVDYYNACADYNSTFVSVPNNAAGYQLANSGNSYIGIFVYQRTVSGGPFDCREYVQTSLTDTLTNGKNYCISFYVNYASVANIAIDNIGLHISKSSIIGIGPSVLPYVPQIISPSGVFLKDTLNWYRVEGTYTAVGGEKYITIGNFKDASSTDTIHTDPFAAFTSYYYIDDVSVILCDTVVPPIPPSPLPSPLLPVISNLVIPNIFTPNNDGNNDVFKIISSGIKTLNCKIYNRWGIEVGQIKNVNETWDGRTSAGVECVEGIYYFILTATGEDDKPFNEKGIVQLVR